MGSIQFTFGKSRARIKVVHTRGDFTLKCVTARCDRRVFDIGTEISVSVTWSVSPTCLGDERTGKTPVRRLLQRNRSVWNTLYLLAAAVIVAAAAVRLGLDLGSRVQSRCCRPSRRPYASARPAAVAAKRTVFRVAYLGDRVSKIKIRVSSVIVPCKPHRFLHIF